MGAVIKHSLSKDKQKEMNHLTHEKLRKKHNGSRIKKEDSRKLKANDVLEISKHCSCSVVFN